MSYIIVTRNPTRNGLLAIQNDDESLAEFEHESEAHEMMEDHPLGKAWGYDVVEIYI